MGGSCWRDFSLVAYLLGHNGDSFLAIAAIAGRGYIKAAVSYLGQRLLGFESNEKPELTVPGPQAPSVQDSCLHVRNIMCGSCRRTLQLIAHQGLRRHSTSSTWRSQMPAEKPLKEVCARGAGQVGMNIGLSIRVSTHGLGPGPARDSAEGISDSKAARGAIADTLLRAAPPWHLLLANVSTVRQDAALCVPYKSALAMPKTERARCSVSARVARPALSSLMEAKKAENCSYERRALLGTAVRRVHSGGVAGGAAKHSEAAASVVQGP